MSPLARLASFRGTLLPNLALSPIPGALSTSELPQRLLVPSDATLVGTESGCGQHRSLTVEFQGQGMG